MQTVIEVGIALDRLILTLEVVRFVYDELTLELEREEARANQTSDGK